MSIFDIVILIFIAIGAIYGFRKGLVMQFFGLLAVLLGVYCAFKFSALISHTLSKTFHIQNESAPIIAFIVTLLVVWILIVMLGRLFEKLVKASALSLINRFLGSLFAVAQCVILMASLVYAFSFLPVSKNDPVKHYLDKTLFYKPLNNTAKTVFPYLDFKNIRLLSP